MNAAFGRRADFFFAPPRALLALFALLLVFALLVLLALLVLFALFAALFALLAIKSPWKRRPVAPRAIPPGRGDGNTLFGEFSRGRSHVRVPRSPS
jgi:hypothetical protein